MGLLSWLLRSNNERRRRKNAKRRKELDEIKKRAAVKALMEAQESSKRTDERIEQLRRIARLGNIE